jgi:steroid delta-isomerase-like uncharacterized protein
MANAADIHRQVLDAWNRRDWDAFQNLLHPDYRYIGPDGNEHVGPEAGVSIAKMYANAFPDGKLEINSVFAAGNHALCELIARGTHRGDLNGIAPTGRSLQLNIANVMETREGKVYREREYFDLMSMMVQLGVIQPPGRTTAA